MPNFDTGHIFLTTLAPIKNGGFTNKAGIRVSYRQQVRIILSMLPTALQSPATQQMDYNSPFARNTRNHLCRMFVIDDVVYNGRPKVVPVIGDDPLTTTHVDSLGNAYLMFNADIDAVTEDGEALHQTRTPAQQDAARDSYARKLWETMQGELEEIYSNCVGFDGVDTADKFAAYIAKCQVKTTMPFNDYWLPGEAKLHQLPVGRITKMIKWPLYAAIFGLIAFIAKCLLGWLSILPKLEGWLSYICPGWIFIVGLILTIMAVIYAYKLALSNGEKPMSAGKYGDLPSVLKSLYLQQNFADFAVDAQGKTDKQLHTAFGKFLANHKPEQKMSPTQHPGVISIKAKGGIVKETGK